jgi:hypothetical protein
MKAFFRKSRLSTDRSSPLLQSPHIDAIVQNSTPAQAKVLPLTLIELFQSQSCNSCPPTNALLLSSLPPNTLLLTYHVTYWNHLSWTDTFSLRSSDARQREYVQRLGLRSAFTPQVVVNGRASGVGNRKEELERLIREGEGAGREESVDVSVEEGPDEGGWRISVSTPPTLRNALSSPQYRLDVSLIHYDPTQTQVHVLSGENAGRVLPHRNVVRSIKPVGEIELGHEMSWVVERARDGLKGVVVVQLGAGGPVVGAVLLDEK